MKKFNYYKELKTIIISFLSITLVLILSGCWGYIDTYKDLTNEEVLIIEKLVGFNFPDDMKIEKCSFDQGRGETVLVIQSGEYDYEKLIREYINPIREQQGDYLVDETNVSFSTELDNCFIRCDLCSTDNYEYIEFGVYFLDDDDIANAVDAIKEIRKHKGTVLLSPGKIN